MIFADYNSWDPSSIPRWEGVAPPLRGGGGPLLSSKHFPPGGGLYLANKKTPPLYLTGFRLTGGDVAFLNGIPDSVPENGIPENGEW